MEKQHIVGKNNTETNKYNYNKFAMMKAVMEGKKIIIVDDGEEYKTISSKLGVKTERINQKGNL